MVFGDSDLFSEYLELRENITQRIDEIDNFYEDNFGEPNILHFEKARIRLKKLLMYNPDIFELANNKNEMKSLFLMNKNKTHDKSKNNIKSSPYSGTNNSRNMSPINNNSQRYYNSKSNNVSHIEDYNLRIGQFNHEQSKVFNNSRNNSQNKYQEGYVANNNKFINIPSPINVLNKNNIQSNINYNHQINNSNISNYKNEHNDVFNRLYQQMNRDVNNSNSRAVNRNINSSSKPPPHRNLQNDVKESKNINSKNKEYRVSSAPKNEKNSAKNYNKKNIEYQLDDFIGTTNYNNNREEQILKQQVIDRGIVSFEPGYDEREMHFRVKLTDNEYALLKKNKMEYSKIK